MAPAIDCHTGGMSQSHRADQGNPESFSSLLFSLRLRSVANPTVLIRAMPRVGFGRLLLQLAVAIPPYCSGQFQAYYFDNPPGDWYLTSQSHRTTQGDSKEESPQVQAAATQAPQS